MAIALQAARSRSILWGAALGFSILAVLATLFVMRAQAAETVLVRGIVKPGGAADHINLYITHVASAPDPSKIRGIRTDVDIDNATISKWEVRNGSLAKVRTNSVPTPEKEVVISGTLQSDNRIIANWVVQNYREFTLEGVLQDRTLDTGAVDQGFVTLNVTKSTFRGVTPERPFKEALIEGKDLQVRVNGTTEVRSLGSTKTLEEVNPAQQKVRVEGQLNDELVWVASKVTELN